MRLTRLAIVFCIFMAPTLCHAHQEPCGLRTMTESTTLIYPPIAKAAHVYGEVITLTTFKTDGTVEKVDVISGPEMLRAVATDYIKSWRANEYTGPRTCPVVIQFLLTDDPPASPAVRVDLQHVTAYGQPVCLCDPGGTVIKRKRFWIF